MFYDVIFRNEFRVSPAFSLSVFFPFLSQSLSPFFSWQRERQKCVVCRCDLVIAFRHGMAGLNVHYPSERCQSNCVVCLVFSMCDWGNSLVRMLEAKLTCPIKPCLNGRNFENWIPEDLPATGYIYIACIVTFG